jgi:hypothetical protein
MPTPQMSMMSQRIRVSCPGSRAQLTWLAPHCLCSAQAYNAAWVRVRASGFFKTTVAAVDPELLTALPFIADCPATPATYPFPPRLYGSRLDAILRAKKVVIAQQALRFPAFETAFAALGRQIAAEIATAYNVPGLTVKVDTYPVSDAAVEAVVQGKADVTDPFYRQWTLTVDNQVQRSAQITPACTMWATFLSISWNRVRNGWNTLEGEQGLGGSGKGVVRGPPRDCSHWRGGSRYRTEQFVPTSNRCWCWWNPVVLDTRFVTHTVDLQWQRAL